MYLCRELTDLSLQELEVDLGEEDHTLIMHACDKITSDIKTDEKTKELLENLKKRYSKCIIYFISFFIMLLK